MIVRGEIGQFNGLTQINPDTLWMVSAGNALFDPTVVTALDETTESQLVTIENLTIVDPADWSNSGSGFNVDVTDGTNTYTLCVLMRMLTCMEQQHQHQLSTSQDLEGNLILPHHTAVVINYCLDIWLIWM